MAVKAISVVWRWIYAAWPMMVLAVYLTAHYAYPFSYYYSVGELYVDPNPAVQGDVRLVYNGGPNHAFLGKYSVIVREFTNGEIVCDASSAPFEYKLGSKRPDPLTIAWWAPSDPRCANLAPGVYSMQTCWTIVDRGWSGLLPDITECIMTPHFRVD